MKNKAMLMSLLGALLALTSCRDLTLPPVFYTLEKEQPLEDDRAFPDIATVHRIVKVGGAGGRYFAAASKLYTRTDGPSENWTVVSPPVPGAMCNTLEVFGAFIYAGFFLSSSGDGIGLWSADPTILPIVWYQEPDPDVKGVEIVMIRTVGAGALLFVSTRSSNANALFYNNGLNFDPINWGATPPPTDIPITDVIIDTEASPSHWVIVGPYLYRNALAVLPGTFDRYSGTPSAIRTFGGLFETGGTVYVSSDNGQLFSTPDGGTSWAKTPSAILDDTDDPIPFASFTLPASDALAVYVGTRGNGYYRIPGGDVTGSSGTPVRSPAYNISALYNGAINCLLYDAGQSRLFLGTAGSGLWRGDHVSGSEWLWKQE